MSNSATDCTVTEAARNLIREGLLTVKQLATWLGSPERRVYYWLGENEDDRKGEPTSSAVNLWIQQAPMEPKLRLAAAQLRGAGLGVHVLCDGIACDPLKMIEASLAAVRERVDAEEDDKWTLDEIDRAVAMFTELKRLADQNIRDIEAKRPAMRAAV